MNDWQKQAYLNPCVFADEVPLNASAHMETLGPLTIRLLLNVGIGYE